MKEQICFLIRYLAIMAIAMTTIRPSIAQENIYTLEKSLEFAQYQYRSQNFDAANSEYKRLSYFTNIPDSGIQYGLSSAISSGNLSLGFKLFENGLKSELISSKSINLYSALLLLNRDFDRYDLDLNEALTSEKPNYEAYLVLNDRWDTLKTYLSQNANEQNAPFYAGLLIDHQKTNFKSPFLSATLSTVVPGSGKLYTGEWKDGLFSMLLIGVLSWQTTRLFEKGGTTSVLAWTGAAIGGTLYFSNIYGSFRSAKNVNNKKRKKLYDQVDNYLASSKL